MLDRRRFLTGASLAAMAIAHEARAWPVLPGIYGATTTPTTGDTLAGGTFLGGIENAYIAHSDYSVATQTAATNAGLAGGAGSQITMVIPTNAALDIPAYAGSTVGDHWYFMRVCMPRIGVDQSNGLETIFGVTGQNLASATGGGVAYSPMGITEGASATGWQVNPGAIGIPYVQRQKNNAVTWQLFGQSLIGNISGAQFAPGVTYGMVVGVHYDPAGAAGAGDYGQFVLAQLGANVSTIQAVEASLISGTTRPSGTQLFNLIGINGNPAVNGTNPNFTGEVSDLWIANGPFPSTAQIQNVTNGVSTMESVCAANGATIVYHNTLDYTTQSGGVIPDDARYTNAGGMTLNNYTGLIAQTSCGPHMLNGVITLTRHGPYWIWPTTQGAADGQVWFEGTCPSNALLQFRVKYQDGTFSPWTLYQASGTTFAASIRIPVKKNFCREVQVAFQTGTKIKERDLHAVGYIVPRFGQSQDSLQSTINATFSGSAFTYAPPTSTATIGASSVGQSVDEPFATLIDSPVINTSSMQYSRSQGFLPGQILMTGYGNPPDGIMLVANAVMQATGVSIGIVNMVHSGVPQDTITWGDLTYTLPTVAGSPSAGLPSGTGGTGPWTFTLALSSAICQNALGQLGVPGASGVILNAAWNQQIKQGTLTITLSDGTVIADNNAASGGTPYSVGGLQVQTPGSPGGGATVNTAIASSFVNYVTASNPAQVQLTLATNPNSATITSISWNVKQEIVDGSTAQKTTFINGYGTWEAFNVLMNFAAGYGISAGQVNWATALFGEITSIAAFAPDITAKNSRVRDLTIGYARAGVDTGLINWPMIISSYARDTQGGTINTIGSIDICRATEQTLWPGGSNAVSWALSSSWYPDIDVVNNSAVHQGDGPYGTLRLGEREGYDWVRMLTGTTPPAPTWAVSNPGGQNTITITPSGLQGGSLTVDVANGGSTTALDSWYIGTATSAGTLVDNNLVSGFAQADIVGNTVVITKATGTWTGSEVVRYIVAFPGAQTMASPRSLVYLTGGVVPAFTYSPGLPMPPLWYPSTGAPDNQHP